MKVFRSHSTKDKEFVQRLAAALDGADFTPWLCEVDIERGENFVAKINKGLEESDLAILVWSPDAAKSSWTEQEWTSLLLGPSRRNPRDPRLAEREKASSTAMSAFR